jgi:hypothetical protein
MITDLAQIGHDGDRVRKHPPVDALQNPAGGTLRDQIGIVDQPSPKGL